MIDRQCIGTLSDEAVLQARAALRAGRHKDLVASDELGIMMRSGRAFEGWREGPLTFPPTFKYKRGTSHYIGTQLPP